MLIFYFTEGKSWRAQLIGQVHTAEGLGGRVAGLLTIRLVLFLPKRDSNGAPVGVAQFVEHHILCTERSPV